MAVLGRAEILDYSFYLLRKNLRQYFLFSFVFSLIVMAVFIITFILGFFVSALGALGLERLFGNRAMVMGFAIIIGIVGLFLLALIFSEEVGIIKITAGKFYGQKVKFEKMLVYSFKSVLKVARLIFTLIILLIPFVIFVYILYRFIFFFQPGSFSPVFEFIIIFGATLIIPFLFLCYITPFSLSLQVMILEGKGALAACRKSWQLVKINFWGVLGFILITLLIIIGINFSLEAFVTLLSTIFYLIVLLFDVSVNYGFFYSLFSMIFFVPLAVISLLIVYNVVWIVLTVLYFNRRNNTEGFDLHRKLSRLKLNRGEE